MNIINKQNINKELLNKNLTCRTSKSGKLKIYNYSKECQHKGEWNETTLNCRGLILDENDNIIARPLPKFFNDFELEKMGINFPKEEFDVYEKMDGSLGILYKEDGIYKIATRGSFDSEQAIEGTKILHEKYSNIKFKDGITYLFEILYPENRIVVDYGNTRDLVLLAMIDTKTGNDIPLEDIGIPVVKKYDGIKDFNKLKELDISNKEGFVIKFKSGFRMKIKFENYFRLHKIVSNLNDKYILEILKENQDFDKILLNIPEEYHDWAIETKKELLVKFNEIEDNIKDFIYDYDILNLKTRKEQALIIQKYFPKEYIGIVFKILDNRIVDENIWDLVKQNSINND